MDHVRTKELLALIERLFFGKTGLSREYVSIGDAAAADRDITQTVTMRDATDARQRFFTFHMGPAGAAIADTYLIHVLSDREEVMFRGNVGMDMKSVTNSPKGYYDSASENIVKTLERDGWQIAYIKAPPPSR